MSKPNLPPPSFYQKHEDVCGTEVGPPTPFWNQAAVEEAVRQALAAQVAKINAAMVSMSMDGVNGGAVQKEYFKAGARRAIQAVNSALRPETSDQET